MRQIVKTVVGIGVLLFLVPFTVYSQDLNSDLRSAAEQGDTATVENLLTKNVWGQISIINKKP